MLYFLTVMDEWLKALQATAVKDKIEPAVADSVQVLDVLAFFFSLLSVHSTSAFPLQVLLKYWDQWKMPKRSRIVRKNSMYYRKLQRSKGSELCKARIHACRIFHV